MENIGETILWVSFGLQIFGALFATICYLPQALRVVKTNDTRSISKLMFVLTSTGCGLWIIIGIINMIGWYLKNGGVLGVDSIAGGVGTIVSNLGLLTCGVIIFAYKMRNIRCAKHLGISEDEYYQTIGKHKNWKELYKEATEHKKTNEQQEH